MSCGLNWGPRLRAQHIGFIRQSSCLSWGGKACQNLHRHLQVICFLFSVLTESAYMPSQGCPRQLGLCSKRPFICVFVPQPCRSSPPLRRACLLRECHCGWHTHFSVCLFSGEAATASSLPNNQRILSVGCYGETCCQSQTGQIKGLSCLLVSKQRYSSAEFTGQTLPLFCAICFSLSNLWPQKKVPVFLTNPRQIKDAVILQWVPS